MLTRSSQAPLGPLTTAPVTETARVLRVYNTVAQGKFTSLTFSLLGFYVTRSKQMGACSKLKTPLSVGLLVSRDYRRCCN